MTAAAYVGVGKIEDFPPGSLRVRQVDADEIVIANVSGTLYGFSRYCTHSQGLLDEGYVSRGEVVCIYHGATFDLRTGYVGLGPAMAPLQTYAVRIEAGEVQVGRRTPVSKAKA